MRSPVPAAQCSIPFQGAFLAALIFFSGPAFSAEVRVFHPVTSEAQVNLSLEGKPRETFRFTADIFGLPDGEDSEDFVAKGHGASEFIWKVRCSELQSKSGCTESSFERNADGVSFRVPDYLQTDEQIEIEVTHVSGAAPAYLVIKNSETKAESSEEKEAGKRSLLRKLEASPGEENRKIRKTKSEDSASSQRGGGGRGMRSSTYRGSRGSKYAKSDSNKKSYNRDEEERVFEIFRSQPESFSGGGGASVNVSGVRGYNRDNTTPVLACSPQAKASGKMEILCVEQKVKVLRVRKPAPYKKIAAGNSVKKKWVKVSALPEISKKDRKAKSSKAPMKRELKEAFGPLPLRPKLSPAPMKTSAPAAPLRPRKPATE